MNTTSLNLQVKIFFKIITLNTNEITQFFLTQVTKNLILKKLNFSNFSYQNLYSWPTWLI